MVPQQKGQSKKIDQKRCFFLFKVQKQLFSSFQAITVRFDSCGAWFPIEEDAAVGGCTVVVGRGRGAAAGHSSTKQLLLLSSRVCFFLRSLLFLMVQDQDFIRSNRIAAAQRGCIFWLHFVGLCIAKCRLVIAAQMQLALAGFLDQRFIVAKETVSHPPRDLTKVAGKLIPATLRPLFKGGGGESSIVM